MPVVRGVAIPLAEIELRASRSGGPGGQHANVTASRVEASFDVEASARPQRGAEAAHRRARTARVVRAMAQDTRCQARNRELALERLRSRLAAALAVQRKRRATSRPRRRGAAAWSRSAAAARRSARASARSCNAQRHEGRGSVPPELSVLQQLRADGAATIDWASSEGGATAAAARRCSAVAAAAAAGAAALVGAAAGARARAGSAGVTAPPPGCRRAVPPAVPPAGDGGRRSEVAGVAALVSVRLGRRCSSALAEVVGRGGHAEVGRGCCSRLPSPPPALAITTIRSRSTPRRRRPRPACGAR